MIPKFLLTLLICLGAVTDGAKILGIFHRPSKSHHILGSTLFKALAKRGHEVTMISPFRLTAPFKNYEEIHLSGMDEFYEDNQVMKTYIQIQNSSRVDNALAVMRTANVITERCLTHPAVKNLLASNRSFDLVIMCWTCNEALLGLAQELGTSTVVFSTIGSSFIVNRVTMNPAPYSYVAGLLTLLPDEMTFYQRVLNTIINTVFELIYSFVGLPLQEEILQKYFPESPSVEERFSNVSLVLLNSHFSIESPRPYVSNMVQVGGLHIKEPKVLKGDLKDFMDTAPNGVIFFSLGSNVRISDLPKDKLEAITKTFAKLPTKVLWKFEADSVPDLPVNVKIGKWFPQADVLAHPNVKLFVTHGGLLSTIESVYHGVPMVGIPFFGDQDSNVNDAVHKNYAVKVRFQDLSEDSLTKAINEVLGNPRYRENAKWRSLVLKDQPLKPLDTAIFWIEYVLRHKGAHHLKTSALKLKWYQYYLLDVVGFLVGVSVVICGGFYLLFRMILTLIKQTLIRNNKTSLKTSLQKKKKSKFA